MSLNGVEDPKSIVDMVTEAQRILDNAKYKIVELIEKGPYREAKTLEDIYYNLEVLRDITHSSISNTFFEYRIHKHILEIYSSLGVAIRYSKRVEIQYNE